MNKSNGGLLSPEAAAEIFSMAASSAHVSTRLVRPLHEFRYWRQHLNLSPRVLIREIEYARRHALVH